MNTTIVVLGEALVDALPSGPVAGGAPFNVARTLAAMGLAPLLVSRIGAHHGRPDKDAALLLDSARSHGLRTDGIQFDAQRPTGRASVDLSGSEHRFRIHDDAAWDHIELAPAVAAMKAGAVPRAIYFGTLAQRSAVSRETLRALLAATTATRFLDLNLRGQADERELAAASLALADWVKVNQDELAHLHAWFTAPGALLPAWGSAAHAQAVTALVQRFDIERLIVTRGADGHAAYDRRGVLDIAGEAAAVPHPVDTIGAGDAFSAVVLAAMVRDEPLAPALARAGRAAAAVCGIAGPLPRQADPAFFAAWRA